MTTIVYRDGKMAADTRAYSGSTTPIGEKFKIEVIEYSDGSKSIVGVSTPAPGLSEEIRRWFASEKHPDFEPQGIGSDRRGFEAIEVTEDGEIFFYNDNFTPSGPLMTDWIAIGSGKDYAVGALSMGATAEEAVGVAINCDAWTGGRVTVIDLKDLKK